MLQEPNRRYPALGNFEKSPQESNARYPAPNPQLLPLSHLTCTTPNRNRIYSTVPKTFFLRHIFLWRFVEVHATINRRKNARNWWWGDTKRLNTLGLVHIWCKNSMYTVLNMILHRVQLIMWWCDVGWIQLDKHGILRGKYDWVGAKCSSICVLWYSMSRTTF